jgi:hypothetical protein
VLVFRTIDTSCTLCTVLDIRFYSDSVEGTSAFGLVFLEWLDTWPFLLYYVQYLKSLLIWWGAGPEGGKAVTLFRGRAFPALGIHFSLNQRTDLEFGLY